MSAVGRQLYKNRLTGIIEEDEDPQHENEDPRQENDDDEDSEGNFPYYDDDASSIDDNGPTRRINNMKPGACGVDPCISPHVPPVLLCDGKDCENTVHRHCAAHKKTRYELHTGDLGADNERVYCSDPCKRSVKKKRLLKKN
jgi:hypothetical protein